MLFRNLLMFVLLFLKLLFVFLLFLVFFLLFAFLLILLIFLVLVHLGIHVVFQRLLGKKFLGLRLFFSFAICLTVNGFAGMKMLLDFFLRLWKAPGAFIAVFTCW